MQEIECANDEPFDLSEEAIITDLKKVFCAPALEKSAQLELAKRIQDGKIERKEGQVAFGGDAILAQHTLISSIGLAIIKIAQAVHREYPSYLTLQDLVHYGVIGAIGASSRYRPELDCTFLTFAWKRIKGEMLDSIASTPLVRQSRIEGVRHNLVHETAGEIETLSGRKCTAEEITAALNHKLSRGQLKSWGNVDQINLIQIEEVQLHLAGQPKFVDLDSQGVLEQEEQLSNYDRISHEDLLDPFKRWDTNAMIWNFERSEVLEILDNLIGRLPDRMQIVLRRTFGIEAGGKEIEAEEAKNVATYLGLSEGRISQLRQEAYSLLLKYRDSRRELDRLWEILNDS